MTGPGPILFNAGFSEEALVGTPQVIRLWKRPTFSAERRRFAVTEFLPGGRTGSREVYRDDGSLSIRQVYRYRAENGVVIAESFDQSGKLLQTTRKTELPRAGEWECATFDREGREVTRSVVTRDETGAVELTELTDFRQPSRIFAVLEKDPSGRPVRSEVRFEGELRIFHRMETIYHRGEDYATMTGYAADGAILVQTELIRHADGTREVRQMPSGIPRDAMRITGERVVSRDAQGNWTEKSLFEGFGNVLPSEPSEIHSREINYY